MKYEPTKAIRINAARWYTRPDFIAFLNSSQAATWHETPGEPGDFSDVFTIWDNGEGSDQPAFNAGLPKDIWAKIGEACTANGGGVHVVWIVNVDMGESTGPATDLSITRWKHSIAENMTTLGYDAWVEYMKTNPEEPEPL